MLGNPEEHMNNPFPGFSTNRVAENGHIQRQRQRGELTQTQGQVHLCQRISSRLNMRVLLMWVFYRETFQKTSRFMGHDGKCIGNLFLRHQLQDTDSGNSIPYI